MTTTTNSATRILDSFFDFFQCAGIEFSDDYENTVAMEVLEEARPIGSSSTSSPTSIYSLPSRESMAEIRQDSMHRFGRSPLFACASSTPLRFSFDESAAQQLETRDDSIKAPSVRSEARQFAPIKRVNSIATASTAESAFTVENLRRSGSEDLPEYQADFVAVRE